MIITIARECGAGGEVIGKLLSEKFNIPFYSWKKDCMRKCRLSSLKIR